MTATGRSVSSARRTWLALVLAIAVALAAAPVLPASAAMPDAEARMLSHINGARKQQGLGTLSPHGTLTSVARNWATRMRDEHEAGGERSTVLRHNPNLKNQLPGSYRRAGENVGYTVLSNASDTTLVDRLHKAYMNSSGHRANIMGEFDRVGVGLVKSSDGTIWSAVVFMLDGAPPPPPPPADEPTAEPAGPAPAAAPEPKPAPKPAPEPAPKPAPAPAPKPEPEPEPEPEPPTTEELFGAGWPEGYLAGGEEVARDLVVGLDDGRLAGILFRSHGVRSVRLTAVWLPGG